MNENRFQLLQKRIVEIVKTSAKDSEGAIKNLRELRKEMEETIEAESLELCNALAAILEAEGDIFRKAKKPVDAEKVYKEMMNFSNKLYQADKETYDYRQGISFYKLASLYRTGLQCNLILPKPKQLNDAQKKLFGMAEIFYKNAMACITEKAKKGRLLHVELHSTIMNEIAVMYASVGNYGKAAELGLNGVQVDKTIYDKYDDKVHGMRLASRMNILAAIYVYNKDHVHAAEILEDANFVLERHEKDEPISAALLLGRNLLNLGGCYKQIDEEKENAEEALLQGLNKILEIDAKAKGMLADDVMMASITLGDHFRNEKEEKQAKEHYLRAKQRASLLLQKTKNARYQNILKRLEQYV
ncbi:MAG: hypothetical protein U0L05_07685 [Schaedlerella sp.]|nr:hypothetical protein [Schaedlerella sp.]